VLSRCSIAPHGLTGALLRALLLLAVYQRTRVARVPESSSRHNRASAFLWNVTVDYWLTLHRTNRSFQMSYNENRDRNGMRDDTSYTGWIIGGVVAIALIIGLFAMFGRDRTNTASDDANRPAATAPATTGSATPPQSGGTSSVPRQTAPATPNAR